MPDPDAELRERQRQEWRGLALLLLAVATVLSLLRWQALERVDRDERERLSGQARVVQQILAQEIGSAYAAMAGTRDDLVAVQGGLFRAGGGSSSGSSGNSSGSSGNSGDSGSSTDSAGASRRLKALADAIPGVSAAAWTDGAGRVLASSRLTQVGQDWSASLPPLQQRDARTLSVRPPVPAASGGMLLQLVLPVAADAGDGALVVTLDPEHVRVLLRSVLYAADMRAGVAHASGVIVVFEPLRPGVEGVNVGQPGSMFARHRDSGQESSTFVDRALPSSELRLVELRSLRPPAVPVDGPLVLALSRTVDAVHAPWRDQTALNVVLYTVLAGGMCALLALMQRRQRESAQRELASARRERAEAERLALALGGADLGLWDHDFRTGHGSVNTRWSEMLGYRPGDIATDDAGWRSLLHPDDHDRVLAAQAAHVDGGSESYEAVYRLRHRSGQWLWVLDRGKVMERGPDGTPLRMAGTHLDISARMQAEQALRRSEESLATTLHSIGDAVIATDTDGRITRINAAGVRMTGWAEADAVGAPLTDVFRTFDIDSGAPAPSLVDTVLASGALVARGGETLLQAKGGASIQVIASAAPIRPDDGRTIGAVLVFSDVSERYRAGQALREREQQLSTIADALPGPVARYDRDGRYLFANAAHKEWFGETPAQVVGRTLVDVLGERRAAATQPYFDRAFAGETVRGEYAIRAADGLRHALVTLLPDRAPDGGVRGVFAIVVDISDRKRAEDALRSSEQKSRELLEHLTTGVLVHDPAGRALDANPAALRMLGIGLARLRSAPPGTFVGSLVDEDGATLAESSFPVSLVVAGGQPVEQQVIGVLRRDRQRPTWLLCSAFPVRTADGRIAQVVVTLLDISERRQAEAERQVLQAQLRESQKMESIGTLAGGIAHDFNNILAAILGNVGLARDAAGADATVQANLAHIQTAALRARSLVQQILAFSRREPGRLAAQPLRPVIDETLSLLRATLPAAVRVDAVLRDAGATVHADATQLQQVLMNLATNAWHALPPGGGRIEIGAEAPAGSTHVHLWVKDDGSGIDAALLQRVFDPFFTTKPVGQGTGLGLSVVHGIVRAHGGTISVDSAPGSGSTFHIQLPLAAPPVAVATAAVGAPAVASAGAGRHVLLVDDDDVVLVMSQQLLQRAGFRVSACSSAATALALVANAMRAAGSGGVDAVVTDYNMPGMSGVELAAALATLLPGVPVVVSSGFVSDTLREQALRAGVRALVKKENSFEQLAATVARVLAEPAAAPLLE